MPATNNRIEYVDLLKGICIFLIVLHHTYITDGCGPLTIMLDQMRMPLYFCVAGLFVSTRRTTAQFVVNKTNRLLVPYVAFNLLYLIVGCLLDHWHGEVQLTNPAMWVRALVRCFNTPLWFLPALFWCYMAYYLILRTLGDKPLWTRALAVGVLAAAGVGWSALAHSPSRVADVISCSQLFNGLVGLPFMFLGNQAARWLQGVNPTLKTRLLWVALLLVVWWACSRGYNQYYIYEWGNHPLLYYIAGAAGVATLFLAFAPIGRLPYISLIGRYSIIVLCTHNLVILLFETYAPGAYWVMCLAILMLSPLIIEVLRRYAPHITAQRDLIPEPAKKERRAIAD